jgi:hypothetical protein
MATTASKSLPKPDRRFGVQWRPNLIRREKRLVLTRIYWNRGTPGDGVGYSTKVSLSLCWAWYDLWVGLFIHRELHGAILYLCLLPCVPIRIHWQRAYGGRYI